MGIVNEKDFVRVEELELSKVKDGVGYAIPDDQSYCDLKLVTKNGDTFSIESLWEEEPGRYRNQEEPDRDESYFKFEVTKDAITKKYNEDTAGDVPDLGTVVAYALELYNEAIESPTRLTGFHVENGVGDILF